MHVPAIAPVPLLTWFMALMIGVVYGVAGTVSQAFRVGVLPVGLLIAVIGSGALIAGVRLITHDRWASLAVAIGVMLATLVFSGVGPGGSVVVPQVTEGLINTGVVWTIAVPLIAAVIVAWPSRMVPRSGD